MMYPNRLHDSLYDKLKENKESDFYPYHMPGHKRKRAGSFTEDLTGIDITEIDGFDDLHQPEGIILEIQKRAAEIYGAEETFLLVNGSTGGVLSAVSAAVGFGGRLLMARNCHKSVYHAAYLRRLNLSFLYPEIDQFGIAEAITADQIRRRLEEQENIDAVMIVSPTYEGRIANVREIAEVVHKKGIPLIVDEAHGAHLGLAEGLALNSCRAGADFVINSVHKTMPALTQTALLHVNGALADREKVRRFLRIYQTSSPSYILMASIDEMLGFIEKEGEEKFAQFQERYQQMLRKLQTCRNLTFPCFDGKKTDFREKFDIGKLVISGIKCGISGQYLYDILRDRFKLQLEMAASTYCLAMFTVNDGQDAYDRMTEACLRMDEELEGLSQAANYVERPVGGSLSKSFQDGMEKRDDAIPFWRAWDLETEDVSLEKAAGRYAGEFINLYPPGIPYVIPGEKITQEDCRKTQEYISRGLKVQGVFKNKDSSDTIYVKAVKAGH